MDVSELSEREARCILRKMCKAISQHRGIDVKLNIYSNGSVNIITTDRETIASVYGPRVPFTLYFETAPLLLKALLSYGTMLHCSIYDVIDINKMFGTSLEELNVNLDLLPIIN